jgi:hypothetical protein
MEILYQILTIMMIISKDLIHRENNHQIKNHKDHIEEILIINNMIK